MRQERRGLVYLINNEQFDDFPRREGTQFDRDNLTRLFTDFHFEVIVDTDLKAAVSLSFISSKHCLFKTSVLKGWIGYGDQTLYYSLYFLLLLFFLKH